MMEVAVDLATRNSLPTAWASSFFRKKVRSAVPLYCALISALLVSSPISAQSSSPTTPPPPPCASDDHRAFDFWLGDWDVTAAGQEKPTAINRISAQHNGCVVREDYTTNGGYTGMSMSFYDGGRKMWHQTWMGADGTPLFIAGGLDDKGAMVLSNANHPGYVEGVPINRVTWTPISSDQVRQHWQRSTDSGKSWTTVFDGTYRRRTETAVSSSD